MTIPLARNPDILNEVKVQKEKVGRPLVTVGFAAETDRKVAVCLLPGTELGFEKEVKYYRNWFLRARTGFSVALFCKVERSGNEHQDALEFPDGRRRVEGAA